jgi:hypothetical protein
MYGAGRGTAVIAAAFFFDRLAFKMQMVAFNADWAWLIPVPFTIDGGYRGVRKVEFHKGFGIPTPWSQAWN